MFLRSAVASIIFSFWWRVGLFAFRRCVYQTFGNFWQCFVTEAVLQSAQKKCSLSHIYRALKGFWQWFTDRSCLALWLEKRQFSPRLSNAGQFLDMFCDRSCPEICSKKQRIRSASPRKFDFRQPILSETLISSVIVSLCWHVGLWAFRRCVRPFFFVLACGSFCVPSRRQWFLLCAGVRVFLRSVVASVIVIPTISRITLRIQ